MPVPQCGDSGDIETMAARWVDERSIFTPAAERQRLISTFSTYFFFSVASGLQRLTPAEGLILKSGVHIPGNTVLSTPTYVLHRDPRNFSHPNDFVPERWMESSKETVHNSKAFSAFGFGPTSESLVSAESSSIERCEQKTDFLSLFPLLLSKRLCW